MLGPIEISLTAGYVVLLAALGFMGLHRLWMLLVARSERHAEQGFPTAGGRQPAESEGRAPSEWPLVTVQLPIFNERYVAERLLRAAFALDYPADRLEVQILDDSTDDTSAILAKAIGQFGGATARPRVVHLRRLDRSGFKAGALQAGLEAASGELIAIFDADFVPPADWLRRVVPDFDANPRLGMVQTRWRYLNRDAGLLARLQATLLDAHFGIEHFARSRRGCFFNFNGTAGLWRRKTIEDAGGWSSATLTEDLHLSYRAQLAGWRFAYRDDIGVPSELPEEMSAFRMQQQRWSKGGAQVLRRIGWRLLTDRNTLPRQKFEAFAHLGCNFSYVAMLLLSLLMPPMLVVRERYGLGGLARLDALVFLAGTLSVGAFYFHAQRREGAGVAESLLRIPVLMALGIGLSLGNARAVIEGLLGCDSPFRRTAKYGEAGADAAAPRSEHWTTKRYVTLHWGLPLVESLLACYAGATLLFAFREGIWQSVPFIALFAAGFALTAGLSARQAWQVLQARGAARQPATPWRQPGEAV